MHKAGKECISKHYKGNIIDRGGFGKIIGVCFEKGIGTAGLTGEAVHYTRQYSREISSSANL